MSIKNEKFLNLDKSIAKKTFSVSLKIRQRDQKKKLGIMLIL